MVRRNVSCIELDILQAISAFRGMLADTDKEQLYLVCRFPCRIQIDAPCEVSSAGNLEYPMTDCDL